MFFRCVFLQLLYSTVASSHLRRDRSGKAAEMDDILKMARHAHQAGDIYVKAKLSLAEGRTGKDVYLASVWNLPASQANFAM